MSRPFMPWYIGDYLRDTGHLTTEQHGAYLLLLAHCWQHERIPMSPGERAAIAKLTPTRWRAICGPINRFFEADGSQKRVIREIERTERAVMQRRIAGKRGGERSGIARAAKKGSEIEAETQAKLKREGSDRFAPAQARHEAAGKLPRTNHKEDNNLSTTEPKNPDQNPAGLLATARHEGALARPPDAEPVADDPRISPARARLEATFLRKRPPNFTTIPAAPCCCGWIITPMKKTA